MRLLLINFFMVCACCHVYAQKKVLVHHDKTPPDYSAHPLLCGTSYMIDTTDKEPIDLGKWLRPISEQGKYGYKDADSQIVIACKYELAGPFRNNIATVNWNGKWGCIDTNGKEIIPFRYEEQLFFKNGLSRAMVGGKCGFINKSGEEVVPCIYDGTYGIYRGLGVIERTEKKGKLTLTYIGLIDSLGKEILPCKYIIADRNQALGLLICAKRTDADTREWELRTYQGTLLTATNYEYIDNFFSNGLAAVQKEHKWGFIDTTGKEVIPCRYNDTYSFKDGYAEVRQGNEWIFIDTTGKQLFEN